ncbi:MAG: trehalose-phosphatase [Chloroflexales bacterium]|nr:trehalose-phosphatase [Chloroflexales bacterium]
MELLHTQATLDAFFARVAVAPHRALLLDYDGTLAPFRIARDQAFPYPGVREVLHTLLAAGRTRVVVISGRAIVELEQLLGIAPLPELWGSHGWERRLADGTYRPPDLDVRAAEGLAAAREVAVARGLTHALEPKPAGLALHWRGLAPTAVAALRAEIGELWTPITLRHNLAVHPFDGGLELRAPGRDKGTAARTLLAELAADTALAYLGDDLTDEDAFRAIDGRGLRVLVRPELRPTAADIWLCPPDDLLAFLRRWAQLDAPAVPTAHTDAEGEEASCPTNPRVA